MIDAPMTEAQKEAFESGYDAAWLGGFSKEDNPYTEEHLRYAWEQGRRQCGWDYPED